MDKIRNEDKTKNVLIESKYREKEGTCPRLNGNRIPKQDMVYKVYDKRNVGI
jgi:hypothetical protein